ncbi:patatin-like phospholipase family protein [Aeromonas veronii]|uniref:patatin-like phospholipase family protein n=1 Tax=Aeromonas veronii TaxID=654 RepID=UPI0038D28A49
MNYFKRHDVASYCRSSVLLFLVSTGIFTQVVYAAERPKICLALSGGGARGAAHIGILKLLEEFRIPVDCIAGTSMGSIVGGLYASGKSASEIEKSLGEMDWEYIFNDDPARQDLPLRRKQDERLYLIDAKPGVTDKGEFKFPTGAIQGQKFALVLRELTFPVSTITDFDKLPIPFRAVATDIGNGSEVVLDKGDLATAMRASMAVPGAFAAVQQDNHLLVDGGLTNNLPIDVVRRMGADIVIAVDISSPYMPADQVTDMFAITAQMTSIMTRTNADRQIASLHHQDILIEPVLGDIGSGDFERTGEAVKIGYQSAVRKTDKLKALSLSETEYKNLIASRANPDFNEPIIDFIRIQSNTNSDDNIIASRLRQQVGKPLDRAILEQDIGAVYGLGFFQVVSYDVIEENGRNGLEVNARAKSWGPNYMQFGLELSNSLQKDDSYNVALSYQRTDINSLGGEIRGGVQFGEEPKIGLEWYQPFDMRSLYFWQAAASYGSYNVGVYDSDGNNVAVYQVNEGALDGSFGREFPRYGDLRAGYRYRIGDGELNTGTPGWDSFNYKTAQVYTRVSVDRLDNLNFPTSGWISVIEYAKSDPSWGSDSKFDQVTARAGTFTTVHGGHVLGLSGVAMTTIEGTAPIQDLYRFGGFLNLSGYTEDSLSGQQAGAISGIYYHHFKVIPLLSWYLGTTVEYGGVWENRNDFGSSPELAGSLFLGANTPLGPVYLGYGYGESDNKTVFFYLGRPLFY